MSAKAVIRMPGEGKEVTLAGKPLAFLVTGNDSKHTCMFDWTLPAGFSTGLHVHRVQEEAFYVLEGECQRQIGEELAKTFHVQNAPVRPLFVKELCEILSGRASWTMLLLMCPLVGYSFFQAVSLYGEASTAGLQSPVAAFNRPTR